MRGMGRRSPRADRWGQMGWIGRKNSGVKGGESRDSFFAEKLFPILDEADQHHDRRADHSEEEHHFQHANCGDGEDHVLDSISTRMLYTRPYMQLSAYSRGWRAWAAAGLSAGLLELPFPFAGPMPPWRSVFAWFALVPLLWAVLSMPRFQPAASAAARIFHFLSVRRALVHRQLLLDSRHDDALRRHAAAGAGAADAGIQPGARALLWHFRLGACAGAAGDGLDAAGTGLCAVSVDRARPGSGAHHECSLGSAWLLADR